MNLKRKGLEIILASVLGAGAVSGCNYNGVNGVSIDNQEERFDEYEELADKIIGAPYKDLCARTPNLMDVRTDPKNPKIIELFYSSAKLGEAIIPERVTYTVVKIDIEKEKLIDFKQWGNGWRIEDIVDKE